MRRGFTLLEMTMVVAISGLMLGFALSLAQSSNPRVSSECAAQTRSQLLTIRGAIEAFARKNDRLPMPAARNVGLESVSYGRESSGANIDAAGGVSFGALPFQALGLPTSYAGDCWGNKYSYAVTTALTTNASYGGFLDTTVNGNITLKDGTGNTINTNTAYAIISHGEDAFGAVKLNYTAANPTHGWCSGAATLNYTNCLANAATLADAPFNNGKDAGANYFDDLIVASGKPQTISDKYQPFCWGSSDAGLLGNGYITSGSTVNGVSTTAQLDTHASGPLSELSLMKYNYYSGPIYSHGCGLNAAGAAYCWGYNQYGNIGDGTTNNYRAVPTAVSGGLSFSKIESDAFSTCALTAAGVAYCWGYNVDGEVGDGTSGVDRLVPTAVDVSTLPLADQTFSKIYVRYYTNCALTAAGKAYCWGNNTFGNGGDGSGLPTNKPTAVAGGLTFSKLVRQGRYSYTTCGLTTGGAIYCWGDNTYGQIGDNTTGGVHNSPTAIDVSSLPAPVADRTFTDISGDQARGHFCALSATNKAYCWGMNTYGEVGDNTSGTNRLVPTAVDVSALPVADQTFANIVAFGYSTCARTAAGTVYCWGDNTYGIAGDGTSGGNRLRPTVAVSGSITFASLYATSSTTTAGNYPRTTACGLTADGIAYCWGNNETGTIGNGTITNSLVPTPAIGGYSYTKLTMGMAVICGTTASGLTFCSGYNHTAHTGSGIAVQYTTARPFRETRNYTQLAGGQRHMCGLTTDGLAYCWGAISTYFGQFGDGTVSAGVVQRPTAVPVSGGLKFTLITAGNNHSCGIRSAGDVYCWGINSSGAIGDNTSGTDRYVPTAVDVSSLPAADRTFTTVTTGANHNCVLTSAGKAYCWGANTVGQVGDNTSGTNRLIPTAVDVSALPVGDRTFKSIAAMGNLTCAVTNAGTTYCWGNNAVGQVGDGTCCANRLAPSTAVAGGLAFASLSSGGTGGAVCALTTTGTAYCWGSNAYGQIGDGNTGSGGSGADRWSPTAVDVSALPVAERTFTSIRSGAQYNPCAMTASGAVYCWGIAGGQIGDDTLTNRLTPTLVTGSGAGGVIFKSILTNNYSASSRYSCALAQVSCSVPWGDYIANGSSVTAYQSATPTGSCVPEYRTCTAGVLSGSYTSQTCTPGCPAQSVFWNGVANGCTAAIPALASGGSSVIADVAGSPQGGATATCSATGVITLSGTTCNP